MPNPFWSRSRRRFAIFTGNLVAIATAANDEGGYFGDPGKGASAEELGGISSYSWKLGSLTPWLQSDRAK